MSWALAAFLLLALALAAGFAWYERSRPPARVLALVAALAALAVIGRIAFAPIPNVKPTTDIVLFAGYALGGAPGFAVGAVTALVSNLFFGQGPWTPWQMAAWGGVGIGGAALARLTRGHELGRLALALPCALAGIAFGLVMDVYQWTLAAEQTAAAFVIVSAGSLWFNAAHAIGNVAFCLLVGPAFLHALARYRRRFEVRWPTGAASAGGIAAVALALMLAVAPAAPAATAEDRAVAYLERAQNSDGGFGGAAGQRSTQLFTGWAALGAAAAGRNPLELERGGRSAIDYVRRRPGALADTGALERTMLVLRSAGLSPRRLGRRDLLRELRRRRGRDGSFERAVNLTAFGVLALRAAGEEPRSRAVRGSAAWLARRQNRDGGFGFAPGSASDVDSTGAVLQALGAAGRARTPGTRRAVAYLRRAQAPSGGFGMEGGDANAQSTAWAVQGLVAAGRDPDGFRRGSRTPLGYLRSLQAADGSVRYSRTSAQTPVWVTAQALAALRRRPFPLAPVARRRRPATSAGRPSGAPAAASPAPPGAAATGAGAAASRPGGANSAGASNSAGDDSRPARSRPAAAPTPGQPPATRASTPAPAQPALPPPAPATPGSAETSSFAPGRGLAALAAVALPLGAWWLWRRTRRGLRA